MVQVEVKHGDVNDNVTFTTLCETKKPTQPYTIYNLDCDKAYNIIPCWMSEANKCCQLDTATYMKVQCPSGT